MKWERWKVILMGVWGENGGSLFLCLWVGLSIWGYMIWRMNYGEKWADGWMVCYTSQRDNKWTWIVFVWDMRECKNDEVCYPTQRDNGEYECGDGGMVWWMNCWVGIPGFRVLQTQLFRVAKIFVECFHTGLYWRWSSLRSQSFRRRSFSCFFVEKHLFYLNLWH